MRTEHTYGPVCWCKPALLAITPGHRIYCHAASSGKEHGVFRVMYWTAVQM